MDFTFGMDGINPTVDLLAACPAENGLSTSKLRARDRVCLPNNQPSSVDGSIDDVLGIFGSPLERKEMLRDAAAARAATKTKTGSPCVYPKYPIHLCCADEGVESNMELVEPNRIFGGRFFETMEDCEPGM